MNFYNDNDPKNCAWLRQLIRDELLPPGTVEARSIVDVTGTELAGFVQCHFFAGIGGWPYALQLAGWPRQREVWTGSCPCQPFSIAGKRKVDQDERNLWPAFRAIIAQHQPAIIFGEQVASKDGRIWLAGVRADLEKLGYAVGAADLCAAGVGAPHIRQRLYWVADSTSATRRNLFRSAEGPSADSGRTPSSIARPSGVGGVANTACEQIDCANSGGFHAESGCGCAACRMEYTNGTGCRELRRAKPIQSEHTPNECSSGIGGMGESDSARRNARQSAAETSRYGDSAKSAGCWSDFDIIPFADGKSRRIERGTFPLADGFPGRVDILRGYGNAIVPQVAAQFIRAYLDTLT